MTTMALELELAEEWRFVAEEKAGDAMVGGRMGELFIIDINFKGLSSSSFSPESIKLDMTG